MLVNYVEVMDFPLKDGGYVYHFVTTQSNMSSECTRVKGMPQMPV